MKRFHTHEAANCQGAPQGRISYPPVAVRGGENLPSAQEMRPCGLPWIFYLSIIVKETSHETVAERRSVL